MIVNEISLMIQNIKPKEDYKIMLLEIFLLVGSSSWLSDSPSIKNGAGFKDEWDHQQSEPVQ